MKLCRQVWLFPLLAWGLSLGASPSLSQTAGSEGEVAAPKVLVTLKPLHGLVAAVMDGAGEPELWIDADLSPHSFAMSPSDARALEAADLVIWLGAEAEPLVAKAVAELAKDDLALADLDGLLRLAPRDLRQADHHHEALHGDEGHDDHDHDEGHDDHDHDEGHDDHGHDEGHDDHGHDEGHDDHDHDEGHDDHNHDEGHDDHNHDEGHDDHDHDEGHDDHDHDEGHDDHDHDEGHDDHGHDEGHDAHDEGHLHGHEASGSLDSHMWLDPLNGAIFARGIAQALAARDASRAEGYHANAEALVLRLEALHERLTQRMTPLKGRAFVVVHDAFAYFENRYGLRAVGSQLADHDHAGTSLRSQRALRRAIMAHADGSVCLFREVGLDKALVSSMAQDLRREGITVRQETLDPRGALLASGAGHYEGLLEDVAERFVRCLSD